MKINLGSGNKYLKGWVNVDLYAEKVDVREDLRKVDFPAESVDRILFIHTIEHLSREDGVDLLQGCFGWLKPGGVIEIETPEKSFCWNLIRSGQHLQGAKGLFGGRSNDKEDWHRWLKEWAANENGAAINIPDKWHNPGEEHLYVWGRQELAGEMLLAEFDIKFEKPQHHGKRDKRDIRIVGTKPCE